MKNSINENGFINRPENHLFLKTVALCGLMLLIAFLFYKQGIVDEVKKVQPAQGNEEIRVVKDSLSYSDSVILVKLIPELRKREGLRLSPYSDGKFNYIGFGHLITKNEKLYQITPKMADSLLWSDIVKAFWEVQRIERKKLKDRVYQVFISGKFKE